MLWCRHARLLGWGSCSWRGRSPKVAVACHPRDNGQEGFPLGKQRQTVTVLKDSMRALDPAGSTPRWSLYQKSKLNFEKSKFRNQLQLCQVLHLELASVGSNLALHGFCWTASDCSQLDTALRRLCLPFIRQGSLSSPVHVPVRNLRQGCSCLTMLRIPAISPATPKASFRTHGSSRGLRRPTVQHTLCSLRARWLLDCRCLSLPPYIPLELCIVCPIFPQAQIRGRHLTSCSQQGD